LGPTLCVLGEFFVRHRPEAVRTGPGGERLPAYLAVRGGSVPREQVVVVDLATARRRIEELRGRGDAPAPAPAAGNPAEALRRYEVCRRLARDEPGLTPTGGIRELVARFLGRSADRGATGDDLPRAQGAGAFRDAVGAWLARL
jgi:hypothetical protein